MIRIAICDDEPSAIAALMKKIHAYMEMKHIECNISTFLDGEALLYSISKKNHFDAIYLDIKMHQINGIDTAKAIRQTDSNMLIVFVSALKEYVFEAFDVSATNFLLKPINVKKLFSTLDKILVQIDCFTSHSLVVKVNGEIHKVLFINIIYCEILNHRLFVYEKNCMHECSGKIDALEKELSDDFFRCHRSYIVNFRFVEKYKDGFAYLSSSEKIPVATRRRQEFMQALLRFQRKEVR